jgi:hypothetical protein
MTGVDLAIRRAAESPRGGQPRQDGDIRLPRS